MTDDLGSKPNQSPLPPIEEHLPFRDWAAFVKLRNDVGLVYDKRAVEAHKISTEFSKLIIINLQFINAGGLLAVPSLSSTLLGLSNPTRLDRLQFLGLPMSIFAVGLLLATLCAFFTYKNYQSVSAFNDAQRRVLEVDAGRVNPRMWPLRRENIEADIAEIEKERRDHQSTIRTSYIYSNAAGWGSMVCFVLACCFMAGFVK